MEKTCTLRELVEAKAAASYFATALDRIAIAKAFIEGCRGIAFNTKEDDAFAVMNPDTVLVKFDADAPKPEYTVMLPEAPDKKDKKNAYDNIDYAVHSVLVRYDAKSKERNDYDISENFAASVPYTITCIAFYIIFACHPFKGARYYAEAAMSTEEEFKYFFDNPDFIFDPASYDSNKIEGYHKCPNDFWGKLSEGQRNFFAEGLCAKSDYTCKELFKNWDKYFTYDELTLKAICGQDIKAYDFGDDHSIIATDVTVWNKVARCIYCNKEIKSKCKDCPYVDKGLVEVTVIEVKRIVVNAALGQKREVFDEKILELKVGERLQGNELDNISGGEGDVFVVIPTKKLGVLGMEYLGEKVISIEPAVGDPYVIKQGTKFKLVAGDKINVSDYVILEVLGKKGAKPAQASVAAAAPNNAPASDTDEKKQDDDKN